MGLLKWAVFLFFINDVVYYRLGLSTPWRLGEMMFPKPFFFWLGLLIPLHLLVLLAPASYGAGGSRENAVVRAVRLASPVVVNISSSYEVRRQTYAFPGSGRDRFFDSFFRDFFDPGFEKRYQRTSLGSGVIIDGKRGYILTNAHVLAKTGTISVILKDDREFEAHIVGADPDSDLAVLRISSEEPLPAIEMGDSDDLMIGETVIAIGNPFGFSHTVTTGVISALNRSIRTEDHVFQDFIQTDASINPGNSGGPLLNITGALIGINTAIYEKAQGIGFAIPINKAKRIIADLIRYGEVIQAWIGISVQDIDRGLSQYLKTTQIKGVLITSVASIGPARAAGVIAGDILVSIGSRPTPSGEAYRLRMKAFAPGDTLTMTLRRNRKQLDVSMTTTVFPLELAKDLAYRLLGVRVADRSKQQAAGQWRSHGEGVIISEVHRQSYLARIGVRPGDIIRQIDEIPTNTLADFEKAIVKYRDKPAVVLQLQREGRLYHRSVELR